MAANEINTKQISEDLKNFLTKEVENNAKKITEQIIGQISTKFDELKTRIEAIDRKADAAESLARQNHNKISILTIEPTALKKN